MLHSVCDKGRQARESLELTRFNEINIEYERTQSFPHNSTFTHTNTHRICLVTGSCCYSSLDNGHPSSPSVFRSFLLNQPCTISCCTHICCKGFCGALMLNSGYWPQSALSWKKRHTEWTQNCRKWFLIPPIIQLCHAAHDTTALGRKPVTQKNPQKNPVTLSSTPL